MNQHAPFDLMAESYDREFTDSLIGRRMRAATWRRIDQAFHAGDLILELNCGSGEDTRHLAERGVRVLATDASPSMLAVAAAKVEAAKLQSRVDLAEIAIEDIAQLSGTTRFDGVLSNFGGLNCVADLQAVAGALAPMVRPGGRALLCVMGPAVPWEWVWYLARGAPRKAFRRLRRGGARWRGLTIRYPSSRRVSRAFAPDFIQRRVSAIGALVPPTYAEAWAARHPRLLALLDRWERRAETFLPLPWLSDHYLVELERTARVP